MIWNLRSTTSLGESIHIKLLETGTLQVLAMPSEVTLADYIKISLLHQQMMSHMDDLKIIQMRCSKE